MLLSQDMAVYTDSCRAQLFYNRPAHDENSNKKVWAILSSQRKNMAPTKSSSHWFIYEFPAALLSKDILQYHLKNSRYGGIKPSKQLQCGNSSRIQTVCDFADWTPDSVTVTGSTQGFAMHGKYAFVMHDKGFQRLSVPASAYLGVRRHKLLLRSGILHNQYVCTLIPRAEGR